MDRADVPSVKAALKAGWKNLLIPIIILLPFLLDYFLKPTLYAKRLGAGAGNMSSSILVFTPGIAAGYALLVNRKNVPLGGLVKAIKESVSGIVPVGATIFFSYCISNLFSATDIGAEIGRYIQEWDLPIGAIA